MTPEAARAFALDWIAAWNAHDLDSMLSHYRDDVEFTSPFVQLLGNPSGTISGKGELKAYFSKALQAYPELHFNFITVFASVNSIVVHYQSVMNLLAAEMMEFDESAQVKRVLAHYTKP